MAERRDSQSKDRYEGDIKEAVAIICKAIDAYLSRDMEDIGSDSIVHDEIQAAWRRADVYKARAESAERDTVKRIVEAMRYSGLNCVSTSGADWVEEEFGADRPEQGTE